MTTYCRMSCNHCNMDVEFFCHDHDSNCPYHYTRGDCRTSREAMEETCPKSCHFCGMSSLSLSGLLTLMQLLASTARASVWWSVLCSIRLAFILHRGMGC
jgi:hypothetical protein